MSGLYVEHAGAGPAVVLLHGFSFDRTMWDPQYAALRTAGYHAVRYDLRGFGASGPPDAGRGHVEDLWAVLDEVGAPAAHLVGLSLGANVALAAAIAEPGRVHSLTLASSGLPGHSWTTPRPPDDTAAHADAYGVAAGKAFWLAHPIFDAARERPAVRAHLERMVGAFPAAQWRDGPATPALPPLAADLPDVAVRTLVLTGARDVPGYREIAAVIAAAVPGAECHELLAGHLLNLERPAEFTAALLDFLARTTDVRLTQRRARPLRR